MMMKSGLAGPAEIDSAKPHKVYLNFYREDSEFVAMGVALRLETDLP